MSHVDDLKVFQRLDEQDPRLNPIPTNTPTPPGEIACHRRRAVDLLLSIFTDKELDPKNPLRRKAADVLRVLNEIIDEYEAKAEADGERI